MQFIDIGAWSATLVSASKKLWKNRSREVRAKFRSLLRRRLPAVYARRRGLALYGKPRLEPIALIQQLQAKGLAIADPATAQEYLRNVNYYRFKVYLRPFLQSPGAKNFASGASFEQARQIGDFDAEFRHFVLELTAAAELNLRHSIDKKIGSYTGNPFWYLDKRLYREFPIRTLDMLRGSFFASKEDFSLHFASRYFNHIPGRYRLLPPFWIISEITTIGHLLHLLSNLDKDSFSSTPSGVNALDELAREHGGYNIAHLVKWLEYIRNVRNVCAHNSRLWNRNFGEPPNLARNLRFRPSGPRSTHRMYYQLAMLRLLLGKSPTTSTLSTSVKPKLTSLFSKYPVVDSLKDQMGFPPTWDQDPFWN